MKSLIVKLTQAGLLLLLIAGCRQPGGVDGTTQPIPFRPAESIDIGQFLEGVHFVQLENTPESAFASINKMIIHEGSMFFFDKKLESVFCFDTTGKFRYRIQNVGRGPGEYQHLNTIWIQPDRNELWIQSLWPQQILAYSLDGRLLRYWPVETTGNESAFLGNNLLVSYRATPHKFPEAAKKAGVLLTDEKGHIIRQVSYFGDSTLFWTTEYQRHFESYGKSQLLMSQKDTIIRIDPDGRLRPDLMMDWGNLKVPENLKRINFGDPDQSKLQDGRYLQGKDQLIAFGPIRIFRVYLQNHLELALANLEMHTGIYSTVITSSQTKLPLLYPLTVSDADELAGLYDMTTLYAMEEMLTKDKLDEPNGQIYREMKTIVDSAVKTDRPIVWMAKIKSTWTTKIE